jgi:TolA-binding protein
VRRIELVAKVLKQDQTAFGGMQVRLQVFGLAENDWRDIARAATDANGDLRFGADFVQADDVPAPNLRLIRASDGAVLSDGGALRYAKTTQALAADFGQIIALPEAVVTPMMDMRRMRGVTHAIGGLSFPAAAAAATTAQPQIAELNLRAVKFENQAADLARENQELKVRAQRAQELEQTNARLDEQARRIPELTRENEQLRFHAVRVQDLELQTKRIPELERKVAETSQLNERLVKDVARVGDLESKLGQSAQENARLKTEAARAIALEKQLGDAQGQIEKLRAPSQKTVMMNAMTTEIGSQVGRAQEQIRKEPGSLGLSSVRIRLKGIVEDGGAKVTLPSAADLAKPEVQAGLSEVEMNFESAGAPPAPADDVQVPDLRRLTESAVRQVLHSIGLRLTSVKGPPDSGGVASGQASLQAPSAGERAKRGATVTVVFAG